MIIRELRHLLDVLIVVCETREVSAAAGILLDARVGRHGAGMVVAVHHGHRARASGMRLMRCRVGDDHGTLCGAVVRVAGLWLRFLYVDR